MLVRVAKVYCLCLCGLFYLLAILVQVALVTVCVCATCFSQVYVSVVRIKCRFFNVVHPNYCLC